MVFIKHNIHYQTLNNKAKTEHSKNVEYQPYEMGKFICLNEKVKEEIKNMSEEQVEMLASLLAYNIQKTQMKLIEEALKIESSP
jgi:hypothetical protein